MRLIGMMLGLAAIGWLLYVAAGGKDADSAIPEAHRESLQKAKQVEQTLKDAEQRIKHLDATKR